MSASPVYGLLVRPRAYECIVCGFHQTVSTNHTDICFNRCPNCSWKRSTASDGTIYRPGQYRPVKYVGPAVTAEEYNPHARRA